MLIACSPRSIIVGVGGQHAPRPVCTTAGEIEFRDARRASGNFLHLAQNLPEEWQARFRSLLAACPIPIPRSISSTGCTASSPARLPAGGILSTLQILVALFSCKPVSLRGGPGSSRLAGRPHSRAAIWTALCPPRAYKERLEEILESEGQLVPHRSPWPDSGAARSSASFLRDILGRCPLPADYRGNLRPGRRHPGM